MHASIFKPIDFLIFALFFGVVVGSVMYVRPRQTGASFLVVTVPDGEYVYPLNKNQEIAVTGALGDSIIVIQDGRAFFKESPCPNQICVQSSALVHNGEWSACLPNQVFMHIEHDGEETDVDALAS